MSREIPTFETHDVDLAAFLMLEGLKFIECVVDPKYSQGKPRVLIRFFDEKQAARDLERAFMTNTIKRYRDFHKYLLKSIHRTLKGL